MPILIGGGRTTGPRRAPATCALGHFSSTGAPPRAEVPQAPGPGPPGWVYALGRFPFALAAAEDADDGAGVAAGRPPLLALSSDAGAAAEVDSGATSIPIRRMLW